jgi:iron uptake system component EfeO
VPRSAPPRRARRAGAPAALPVLALLLAACTSGDPAGRVVAVTASETACRANATELAAGLTRFRVTNAGTKRAAVHVLRPDGSVVTGRSGIAPEIVAELTADLTAGDYTLRCRPDGSPAAVTTTVRVVG